MRVLRLERRRRGGDAERAVPAPAAGREAVLRARPGRLLRLPGSPPDRLAARAAGAAPVMAGELLLLGSAAERQRHRRDDRHRAAEPLEALLAHGDRGGARERRGADRHARRVPGRHAAHPPGAGDRVGRRRAGRPARPRAVRLRGPDGHRRRAPRRLQGGRDPVGQPVGGRAALHLRLAQSQGGARPALAPRAAAGHPLRHHQALAGRHLVRARGLARRLRRREDQPLRARAREPRRRPRRGRRRRGVPAAARERRRHRGADRALPGGARGAERERP